MKELVEALKAIADTQRAILDEIKNLGATSRATTPETPAPGSLVPMKMPDGSVQMVQAERLRASTGHSDQKASGQSNAIRVVESATPILRDPWPDPSVPKPPLQR